MAVIALGVTSSAIAHQVQVGTDVGVTLHIEPNDIAQAGVPTPVWFALTQAGGQVIPLAECDCRVTLYDSTDRPIATPLLRAINAEGYTAIPGTEVTFPSVGAYTLALSGTPQGEATFTPFQFRFPVLVSSAARSTAVTEASPTPIPSTPESNPGEPTIPESPSEGIAAPSPRRQGRWWVSIPLMLGIFSGIVWQYRRSRLIGR